MTAQSFLLTRPAAASARFAERLRDSFGAATRIVIAPLMEPVFLNPVVPAEKFDALILTSETGAEAARRLSAEGRNLPLRAWCVGDQTAQAASDAGFHPQSAKGNAAALVHLIKTTQPGGRFLYLRGRCVAGNLAENLDSAEIMVREVVVYDQKPCPLTAEAAMLLAAEAPVVLPLFSPRSASLLAQSGPFLAPLWIAALSPAVADCARRLHPVRLAIAATPDATTLLHVIENLCVARGRT